MGQCRPEKAGELAGDGGDDELFGFPADGEAPIAAVQPPLCVPRDVDRGGWGAALPPLQRGPQKRMMAILPGGFDEHTSEMRVRRRRSTNRIMVGLSDVSVCSAGVRWPGNKTAATVVAAC